MSVVLIIKCKENSLCVFSSEFAFPVEGKGEWAKCLSSFMKLGKCWEQWVKYFLVWCDSVRQGVRGTVKSLAVQECATAYGQKEESARLGIEK